MEKNGIDARVQDERKLQRFWFAAAPQAGVHVRVPEKLTDETARFLEANQDAAAILLRAVRCPSCQSCRIEYPAMTRKNVLPTLVAHVAVALRFTRHECYCEDCHYTWVRPNTRRKFMAEY